MCSDNRLIWSFLSYRRAPTVSNTPHPDQEAFYVVPNQPRILYWHEITNKQVELQREKKPANLYRRNRNSLVWHHTSPFQQGLLPAHRMKIKYINATRTKKKEKEEKDIESFVSQQNHHCRRPSQA